ncbi:hypothetical protein D9615_010426 [Tricholomella constricta]|uniref:Xylanolytic transcriptional activator regulatory domain-containing protein n=1 Tax=Tricholomella constricta TaxID=117010 RepID=A0A8H5GPW6_9AGAR|nr:hypothetical protein D9615_010426 [Tricholomella constricta]
MMYGLGPPPPPPPPATPHVGEEQSTSTDTRPVKRARNTLDDRAEPYHYQYPQPHPHPDSGTFAALSEHSPTTGETTKNARQDTQPLRGPQEKDKNRRLSCKECRRLKLKVGVGVDVVRQARMWQFVSGGCIDVWTWKSVSAHTLGSSRDLSRSRPARFILANTEQLHEKITVLSDRVRDLEDALQVLQSTCSNQPHPLLSPELLRIKTSQDLYIAPQPAATQAQAQAHPIAGPSGLSGEDPTRSTGALSLTQPPYAPVGTSSSGANDTTTTTTASRAPPPDVPPDILQLSSTFPFPWCVDLSIRRRIRDALPPRHEAQAICEEARNNALWQYYLDASETFLQNLIHHCYATSIEDLSPRRLALLLMVLSVGSLVDLRRPLGSLYGEAYHHLARAAVCEIPLMEEPDFDVLHALFFMIWWHLVFSDNKKAVGYAWNLMGFVAKLAQGLGLHRDNPRLKGIPEEDEKRRAVFWELLNLDARMSLSLGRPPSICLRHVETKPPAFRGPGMYVSREEIVYHEWKNAFFIQCLTPVLEAVVVVEPLPYEDIVELDRRVREFAVPEILSSGEHGANNGDLIINGAEPRFLVMQRALVATSRDVALLQLHRRFFTATMSRPDAFDLHHHAYAPSVLATCLGAASLIASVEALFDREPQLSARFLYFWFNTYNAAATLALFVARAPAASFAPEAQTHLDKACRLFARAAQILPLCRGLLHVAEKLADKSRLALSQYQSASALVGLHATGRGGDVHTHAAGEDVVPESFHGAHPVLRHYAEQQQPQQQRMLPDRHAHAQGVNNNRDNPGQHGCGQESYLPDIYRYPNAGVSRELRYAFPFPPQQTLPQTPAQTPFIPGAPRVNANEEFNFDHGALGLQCEETGYMAWF